MTTREVGKVAFAALLVLGAISLILVYRGESVTEPPQMEVKKKKRK